MSRASKENGLPLSFSFTFPNHLPAVPAGQPSRGGDVAVYIFDMNDSSLSTSFYSVLVSIPFFMTLSTVFHSIISPNNSAFSLCSSGLISALLMCSLVTSIFLYACESWTLTAELHRRIQAMEMRCYRKILLILHKDHVTNKEVHAMIQQAI